MDSLRSPHPWRAAVAAQLAIVLAVVAMTFIGYNLGPPQRFAADQALRQKELRQALVSFQAIERAEDYAFLWTNGQSQVCLQQHGRVARSIVSIMLLGKGANALGHHEAALLVNGQPLANLPIVPATRRYQLLVGSQLAQKDDSCFTIASATTAVPSHTTPLGVPFASFTLAPIRGAITWPALYQSLINVAVALTSFWMLRALSLSIGSATGLVLLIAGTITALITNNLLIVGVGVNQLVPPLLVWVAAMALGAGIARRLAQLRLPAEHLYAQLLTRDLIGMAFWSLLLWGGTEVLQQYSGHISSVWPLKARINPAFTPLAALPVTLFVAWLALLLWQLRAVDRASGDAGLAGVRPWRAAWPHLAFLLVSAVILPVVLKGAVRSWDSIYITFRDSVYEYQRDVPLVSDLLTLLKQYVALAPTLSLHTSTHPPGSLLLLWAVAQIFGPGAVATSWAAILLSSLGALAAFWLGWRIAGPTLALLAGALFVVMPGQQVYSVTSMDAVFAAMLSLGAVSFLLALEPRARPGLAILSGVLIAIGLFFTYTATMLAFFGLAVFAIALRRGYTQADGPRSLARAAAHPLRQASLSAATIIIIYLLVWQLTGFNVLESIHTASAINHLVMNEVDTSQRALSFLPISLAFYTDYLAANIIVYFWYLAPWGLAALSSLLLTRIFGRQRRDIVDSATFGLAGLVAGMWLVGIFMREVERIWAFTYPIAAALIAYHVWQGATPRIRLWRAGLFTALFIAQSVFIRVMLYTYW